MTKEDVAGILYRLTAGWRDTANSEPSQFALARAALAGSIWSSGAGFPAPSLPGPGDFGDPERQAVRTACWTAASQAAAGQQQNLFILRARIPQSDPELLAMAPALKDATTVGTFGPFVIDGSQNGHHLHVLDAPAGLAPGLFPPDPDTASPPPAKPRKALLFVGVLIAALLFAGLCYGAYGTGVSISSGATAPGGLAHRLAKAIVETEPRLEPEAAPLARDIVKAAKLIPDDHRAWWQAGPEPATGSAIPKRPPASEEQLALLAGAAAEHGTRMAAPRLEKLPGGGDAKKVGAVVARGFKRDPIAVRPTVTLLGWWTGATGALMLIAMLVGYGARGTVIGVLIGANPRLSLSKMQQYCWTILVLSLFGVTSAFLLGTTGGEVSSPTCPWQIWALLGIAIGTPPLSGLIITMKEGQEPPPNAKANLAQDNIAHIGRIAVAHGWSLLDLFRGEEVTNDGEVDVSRFQQVIVTIVLIIIFVAMTGQLISNLAAGTDWAAWALNSSHPKLSDSFLMLLGLSHAGYLVVKALPKPDVKRADAPARTTAPAAPVSFS